MEYTVLGRSGLKVTVMGFGCGGPTAVGSSFGWPDEKLISVIRKALDLGVNFFDTSQFYGTEEVLGLALKGVPRDQIVVSTKTSGSQAREEIERSLDASLKRMGLEYVDLYMFHDLNLEWYDHAVENLIPEMIRLRDRGKIRAIGFSESGGRDQEHRTALRAVQEHDFWDAILITYSIVSQKARTSILPLMKEKNVGCMVMFSVRKGLTDYEDLGKTIKRLIELGAVNPAVLPDERPVRELLESAGILSLPEAAYRFTRFTPGVHAVLCGSTNPDHIGANARTLTSKPLPPHVLEKLVEWFQNAWIEF